ncbi:methanol/ethanol family PQQ-dependent dehydrogenase [Methylobacterium gnaphalii]|uniref:Methanol dehydrogenase n=1 Tax=Methylobacterium gnaphalii TaxID=1010610 RepID=A0A512JLH0_9HYPH|nr:methanol/ethanol family PQQ-dependent dehydrogenase [Methylobacterium gnaphalii]GEP10805.1 methanol dehydrogenase [Methylobacterium gnaphalii]GJD71330.1 Methanol dehydrogenase [cytochrome c] subunit 1 [Methylobacterium gnaphalii]GLS49344.1 methanol dehydrogenase [Methylobacterium gnaphalii]
MKRLLLSVLLWSLAGPASAVGQAERSDLETRLADPGQQVIQTVDYANTRYSRLDQVTAENVSRLKVAWTFSTGVLRGHEGAPLVVGHRMYVHTPFPNTVYALDLDHEGRILWSYAPKQAADVVPVMCCDTVNRGLAYADGAILLHQNDTTLVSLDAETGRVNWSVKNGDPAKGETNTATVLPVKDLVIVGISGGEYGARCHVTAYGLKDGKRIWRAYATGPDEDMLVDPDKTTELGKPIGKDSSLKTWDGDQWRMGGGCAWGWFSYDPALDLLYYGTGNPSTWNPAQRSGDNKWAMSIVARHPETGRAAWLYQMTPHDQWDYDGVNEMILTDQEVDGRPRHLLTHFDRNGFGYSLDRATGELVTAEKFDPTVNWATAIDRDRASPTYGRPLVDPRHAPETTGEDEVMHGICPSALGAKNQQPAAYSPQTHLFYVPTNHFCMDYEPFHVTYVPGQPYVGATLGLYPPPGTDRTGNVIAWDGVKGRIAWSLPERFSVWSGTLATAGGVVFYGTLEGWLKAVDARDGHELYRFKTPSGIVGNPMTFMHDGRQYVAVLSGVGGWAGIGLAAGLTDPADGSGAVGGYAALSQYTAAGGQLTVFALP